MLKALWKLRPFVLKPNHGYGRQWVRKTVSRKNYRTSTSEKKGENFVVRIATTPEDFNFAQQLLGRHDWWVLGAHDTTHVLPKLKPGLFIGFLNGKRIAHILTVKYGSERNNACYCTALYVVDSEYQGKGYGMKLVNEMLRTLDKSISMSVDAVQDMAEKYKRVDLQPEWATYEYDLRTSKVCQALDGATADTTSVSIKPLSEVEFDQLVEYDGTVLGFRRPEFLKPWITIPNSLGWVVTSENGSIIRGYTVIRQGMMARGDQIIGPLFSDDAGIARLLLYTAAKAAISQRAAKSLKVFVPAAMNKDSVDIIENEIGFEGVHTYVRMYTKGVPPQVNWRKTFALTGYF